MSRASWDRPIGLNGGLLYGGEVGFGFGQYLELSILYGTSSAVETDFSDLDAALFNVPEAELSDLRTALAELPARTVGVRRFGTKLRLNILQGTVVPFVTAGTGILRLNPEDLNDSRQIYASAGAGLALSYRDRVTFSLAAENLAVRTTLASLLAGEESTALGLEQDDLSQATSFNPVLTASATFYLGGGRDEELTDLDRALQQQLRPSSFSLAIEPFYGSLRFRDALAGRYPDQQRFVGVAAGFDLGPQIGLRGFYGRGLSEESGLGSEFGDAFEDIAMYGGMLHLRFNDLQQSLAPYLSVGGGYLNVDEIGYAESVGGGIVPEDQYFALGGLGAELPLSSVLTLQGGVQGLFLSTQDVDDVADASEVYINPLYHVGLAFRVGPGASDSPGRVLAQAQAEERRERQAQADSIQAELNQLRAEVNAYQQAQARRDSLATVLRDSIEVAGRPGPAADTSAAVPAVRRSNLSGETLTIPVPEVGEIYIRFGPRTAAEDSAAVPRTLLQGSTVTLPADTANATASDTLRARVEPADTAQVPASPPDTATVDTTVSAQVDAELRRLIAETVLANQQAQDSTAQLTEAELQARLDELERDVERRMRAREDEQRNRQDTDNDVRVNVVPTPIPVSPAPDTTGGAPADSLAMPADSLAMPADSLAMPADSLAMPADSLAMPADSLAMPADS
ncbi:MAG: hypothetical protein AAGI71_16870, partial [Bacteroidota bacterium]